MHRKIPLFRNDIALAVEDAYAFASKWNINIDK
jgi:hypothetical protein